MSPFTFLPFLPFLPFIIGGHLAPEDPAIVALLIHEGANTLGHCTAEVIGPHTVVTAKHCATGPTTFVSGGKTINVIFKTSDTLDIAVGTTDIQLPGIDYLKVVTSKQIEKTDVQIAGFGCYDSDEDFDGKFRVGDASIESIDDVDYTLSGPAVVCPGDSGGAATITGTRNLIAVISAVVPWDKSIVVRLDTPAAQELLKP